MTENLSLQRPPKVFISYSHDSPEHKDRVLGLCNRLREDGVDAWIDQYETSPPEGWPRWCANQIQEADYILVICTETYHRRFLGKEEPGRGMGTRWEGYVAIQELYEAGVQNTKFIPVLLPPASEEHIPIVLRGSTRYDSSREKDYWRIIRYITGQPEIAAPPLGVPIPLAPEMRRTLNFAALPEPRYYDERTRKLGEDLAEARRQLKDQTIAGQSTEEIRQKILQIRREMRDGGRLQPGDWLNDNRFQLLDILGRGGFATVWKAWDEDKQKLVAVKVLHGLHSEDRSRRERFFRGARKMAELHHPGIVRVVEEHLEESGHHYFVMEYIAGGDLRQTILLGRLSQEEIISLILAIGESLAFAHDKGIIHRDIKPANILLENNRPRLTDFDLVRAFDTTGGTQTQGHFGTFLYTAPEVLTNAKDAGVSADVYSLAMTAAFAFHGRELPPEVWRRPEAFFEKLPCPTAIRDILRQGIAWEEDERPRSINELCEALRQAAQDLYSQSPLEHRPTGPPQQEKERINPTEGSILVYVPGGGYMLGSESLGEASMPVHCVELSSFWIGKYPITNRQYNLFLRLNPAFESPEFCDDERFNKPGQPVVGITWEEAQAYCNWANLQLPTEAQWEAAARGTNQHRFPWGDEEPSQIHANFGDPQGQTSSVGTYPKGIGPFGTLDQAGNVWEWCKDVWDEAAYQGRDGEKDPVSITGDPSIRCLRGGSWSNTGEALDAAFRFRDKSSYRLGIIGFRCLLASNIDNAGSKQSQAIIEANSLTPAHSRNIENTANYNKRTAAAPLVLIVDATDNDRASIIELLELRGVKIAVASDGTEAFDLAYRLIPDLILMELFLSGQSGREAARRLKNVERTRPIPIVAMTFYSSSEVHSKALQAGCESVITRPIAYGEFEKKVMKHIKAYRPSTRRT